MLEKSVSKLSPELKEYGNAALLEAYRLEVLATSEEMINLVSAEYKAREKFPPGTKPPDNSLGGDRW